MTPQGAYFDGRSGVRHRVFLYPAQDAVWLRGDGVERREPLAEVEISERLGSAPCLIRFRDGALCQVEEGAELDAWLKAIGHRERTMSRLQRSTGLAIAALLVTLLTAYSGYRWGLPWIALQLAERMPSEVGETLTQQTIAWLDRGLAKPSTLKAARRQKLEQLCARLQKADGAGAGHARLLFRSAPRLGPNAFALPDGSILMLDEMVNFTQDDQEIAGVIAHELGHVRARHALRAMAQGTLLGAVTAWWLGDFSPLIASAPVALLNARYSQAFETEADGYAIQLMQRTGMAPGRLGDLLERLEVWRQKKGKDDDGVLSSYLSSHPPSEARVRMLKGLR